VNSADQCSALLALAERLPGLIAQAEQLETMVQSIRDAHDEGRVENAICRRAERWAQSADAALEAAEKFIAAEPARTLAEAAIQIMLAVSRAQILSVPNLDEAEREGNAAELERLLQSALPVIAEAAGIELSEFGRAYYADRRTDPFYRGATTEAASAHPILDGARLKAAGFG
jgi:hypothetical protein